jgi:hypothetical protein
MMFQGCKTLCVPILGVHFGTFENLAISIFNVISTKKSIIYNRRKR